MKQRILNKILKAAKMGAPGSKVVIPFCFSRIGDVVVVNCDDCATGTAVCFEGADLLTLKGLVDGAITYSELKKKGALPKPAKST